MHLRLACRGSLPTTTHLRHDSDKSRLEPQHLRRHVNIQSCSGIWMSWQVPDLIFTCTDFPNGRLKTRRFQMKSSFPAATSSVSAVTCMRRFEWVDEGQRRKVFLLDTFCARFPSFQVNYEIFSTWRGIAMTRNKWRTRHDSKRQTSGRADILPGLVRDIHKNGKLQAITIRNQKSFALSVLVQLRFTCTEKVLRMLLSGNALRKLFFGADHEDCSK